MQKLRRRDAMVRLGQVGLGALTLSDLLRADRLATGASRDEAQRSPSKAKACILIYLWGGPPQMDVWDPNREAPDGIRSHFKPISTVLPGIQVSDQLPLFAKHAAKGIAPGLEMYDQLGRPYRIVDGKPLNSLF